MTRRIHLICTLLCLVILSCDCLNADGSLRCRANTVPRPAQTHSLAQNDISGEFYGSLYFLSNYVSDGLSNTDNKPAIQGDIGFREPFGLNAGLWASNTMLYPNSTTTIEFDPYIGWASSSGALQWDIYVAYLLYLSSGTTDINYWETRGKVGYQIGELTAYIGLAYAPNYANVAGTFISPNIEFDLELPEGIEAYGLISHVHLSRHDQIGLPDYTYWHVGLKKTLYDWLQVGMEYYGSDIRREQCLPSTDRGLKICGSGALIQLGHAF